MFICPKCGGSLADLHPGAICGCRYIIPTLDRVFQFTREPAIKTGGELMWLGYEKVGINYEPGYAMDRRDDGFGMFGACSRKLVKVLGRGCVVLDLGAGLGQASIPLALAGARVISVDISQVMMALAQERAARCGTPPGTPVFARMNAYELYIADSSVDAIVEIDMLHQVNRPELVINEIKRILKPGGLYVRYNSRNLELTDAEKAEKDIFGRMRADIEAFYAGELERAGYTIPEKSGWDDSYECRRRAFGEPEIIKTDEVVDIRWNLGAALHKRKTRAAGMTQLIPDEIHKRAWEASEKYAATKYGDDYDKTQRTYRFYGVLEVYRV